MQGLDRPLLPDVAGQIGRACLPGLRAGDAERGDRRDRLALQVGDVALDEEDLADVREREPFGGGQDLDGAGGDRPWPLSVAACAIGTSFQGRASMASNSARRFSLTGKTNSPPRSRMRRAVAFTVCSASYAGMVVMPMPPPDAAPGVATARTAAA